MPSRFYNIHDLVRIRLELPGQVTGALAQHDHFQVSDLDEPNLLVRVGNEIPDLSDSLIVQHRYFVAPGRFSCHENYKSGRWQMAIKGIDGGLTAVDIDSNRAAYLAWPYIVMNSMIGLKLLEHDHALVHACGICRDGRGVAFIARGGVGKTLMTFDFDQDGFSLAGDNLIILGARRLLSFPLPLKVKRHNVQLLKTGLSLPRRREFLRKSWLSRLTGGWVDLATSVPPTECLLNPPCASAELGAVILLIGAETFRPPVPVSVDTMVEHILRNMRLEAGYFSEYILAYACEYPDLPFARYWERLADCLRRNLEGLPCFVAHVPSRYERTFYERILQTTGCF